MKKCANQREAITKLQKNIDTQKWDLLHKLHDIHKPVRYLADVDFNISDSTQHDIKLPSFPTKFFKDFNHEHRAYPDHGHMFGFTRYL